MAKKNPEDKDSSEAEKNQNHYDVTKVNSEESDGDYTQRVNTWTLVTFGFAIMLHSLIDGLAIGVFKEASEMLVLSASVIIHKVPVACTVGTTFKSNGQHWKKCSTLTIFILFILASPTGMMVGMILGETSSNLALVIVQGFSGGTFIYLACCDLLIHEFHNDH